MNVALVYQPLVPRAADLAASLARYLADRGHTTRDLSLWNGDTSDLPADAELIVSFGGDGSILRATRLAAPRGIPVVGVNLGRVGFLAEIEPGELPGAILPYLNGDAHLEERLLVEASVKDGERPFVNLQPLPPSATFPLLALNEVFVGRGAIGRLVKLDVAIDGVLLGQFRADGIIVATPTGSTAYALAAGGPAVGPDVDALTIVTVAAQSASVNSVVIPAFRTVEITVHADHPPVLSSDGLLDVALQSGDTVIVRRSQTRARFWRSRPSEFFYQGLADRLR